MNPVPSRRLQLPSMRKWPSDRRRAVGARETRNRAAVPGSPRRTREMGLGVGGDEALLDRRDACGELTEWRTYRHGVRWP